MNNRRAIAPRSCRGVGAAGFTLIEMLVVLGILALVAGIALPRLSKSAMQSYRLAATTRELVGALRLARAAAIVRAAETTMIIDVERHTYESPAVAPRVFAPEVEARLTIAEPERLTPARGGFRFFPDGSSTGGEVMLRLGGRAARICVNWLNGEARNGADC